MLVILVVNGAKPQPPEALRAFKSGAIMMARDIQVEQTWMARDSSSF